MKIKRFKKQGENYYLSIADCYPNVQVRKCLRKITQKSTQIKAKVELPKSLVLS